MLSSKQVTNTARPVASSRSCVVCHASKRSPLESLGSAAAAVVAAGMIAFPAVAADGVSLNVKDGATVSSPVHLDFSVSGMTVKPASEGLQPGTGHFHVLVDESVLPEEGETIPFDATHLHYGKGQLGADVELAPGKHTLTLQFANALHQSYGNSWASTVTVNVP